VVKESYCHGADSNAHPLLREHLAMPSMLRLVKTLYAAFRFTEEGLKVRGRKLEDRYQDVKLMAPWL